MKNIVILISGGGSNMKALVGAAQRENWAQRHGARIVAVISNKADSAGLAWAQAQGLATAVLSHRDFASREAFDAQLAQLIDLHAPALVLLAGFMRILTPGFVARYEGRLGLDVNTGAGKTSGATLLVVEPHSMSTVPFCTSGMRFCEVTETYFTSSFLPTAFSTLVTMRWHSSTW